jgi:putative Ca2+/H+ antiporter (TMEM165/GDT1 family)
LSSVLEWIIIVHEFFIALGISFTAVFTAELGDKTQLFTFLLGTYFSERKLLLALAVFTGMGAVTLIGVGIAKLFQHYLELSILQIIGGSVFITLGALTLGKAIYDRFKERENEACEIPEEEKTEKRIMKLLKIKNPFLFVGLLSIFYVLMELGDKSQIMILMLLITNNWVGVFIGAMIAFMILNVLGIFAASFVKKLCDNNPLIMTLITAFVSLALGFWMILTR